MSTELIVSLPAEAVRIETEIERIELISVNDDRTNISAAENLKVVSKLLKDFELACEPERIRLRTPLDQFLGLKKQITDKIESWIRDQKKSIGAYSAELMRLENARREEIRSKQEEEARIEAEKKQAERKAEAEAVGAFFEPEQIPDPEPIPEPVQVEKAIAKSEFVNSSVKMKVSASVSDKGAFIATLLETGNAAWINLIFDKVNQTKLNDFCKAMNIDGVKSKYPGLRVEMIPDVRVR